MRRLPIKQKQVVVKMMERRTGRKPVMKKVVDNCGCVKKVAVQVEGDRE